MSKKPTVALIYDFDGTLSPGNMQEYDFIPAVGKSNKEFWHEANSLAEDPNGKTQLSEAAASIPPLKSSSNSLHNYQILLYLKTKNDGWIAVIYSTKLIRTLNSLFHTLWTEIVCVKSKSFLTLHYNPIRLNKYLVISTATNEVRVAPEKIVFISSDSNYFTLVLANDESKVLDLQLGLVEKLIESQLGKDGNTFIRIGRSHIINHLKNSN